MGSCRAAHAQTVAFCPVDGPSPRRAQGHCAAKRGPLRKPDGSLACNEASWLMGAPCSASQAQGSTLATFCLTCLRPKGPRKRNPSGMVHRSHFQHPQHMGHEKQESAKKALLWQVHLLWFLGHPGTCFTAQHARFKTQKSGTVAPPSCMYITLGLSCTSCLVPNKFKQVWTYQKNGALLLYPFKGGFKE